MILTQVEWNVKILPCKLVHESLHSTELKIFCENGWNLKQMEIKNLVL